MELLSLAKLLIGQPHALGTILLAYVYQAFILHVTDEPYHRVGRVLWFVQLQVLTYFSQLSSPNYVALKSVYPSRTMSSDGLMSFSLGLTNHPTWLLYLKPDIVSSFAWEQFMGFVRPYLQDFEGPTFIYTACRVLVSEAYVSFSPFLYVSSVVCILIYHACGPNSSIK